jgi:hypothetical protein
MWMRSTTFLLFIISLSVLAVGHILSLTFYLYWTYLWLDIPMHFLGGMTVALGLLTFFAKYVPRSLRGFVLTLGVVFVVGIAWEVFELVNGLIDIELRPIADTLLDLVLDLMGGALGYALARATSSLDTNA